MIETMQCPTKNPVPWPNKRKCKEKVIRRSADYPRYTGNVCQEGRAVGDTVCAKIICAQMPGSSSRSLKKSFKCKDMPCRITIDAACTFTWKNVQKGYAT